MDESMMGYRTFVTFAIWTGVLVCTSTACSPGPGTPTIPPAKTSLSLATATLSCEQTPIPPLIAEIQPALPKPGDEITVIGSGGLIQDSCGGYIEGLREFPLYLDREPVGSISCYINRCEGKFMLPDTATIGPHCLIANEASMVEPDQCPFEFEVVQE